MPERSPAPDRHYSDPRLAALYDALNPPGPDTHFFVELAGEEPIRVLDLGCGTGHLAVALAEKGHAVTGVDPAPGMLAVARAREGAERVAWVQSDASGLALPERFDLVIMTGHVFQVFLTDSEISAVLRAARLHLAPGGRLAFETRNPGAREWESWTEEASSETVEVEGIGKVTVHYQVIESEADRVSFETRFDFQREGQEPERVVSASTLRFLDAEALEKRLTAAAFREIEWYGDWDRSPMSETSAEIIVVAR